MIKSNRIKTIWIINHYASHLEQRHLELGRIFASKGYSVAVITSAFQHGSHSYKYQANYTIEQRDNDLFFIYLRTKPTYQDAGIRRVINMVDFWWETLRFRNQIERDVGIPNFVIGSSAHPFVWESAYRIAKSYGAKFIAEFRDIWPMSLVDIQGMSPRHPLVILFNVLEKRAYRRADAIVATMPYADRHVCDEMGFPRTKFHWMPNGIRVNNIEWDTPIPKNIEEFLTNNWCCVYTGSLVKSEYLGVILQAMKELRNEDVHLAIVGGGNLRDEILKYIHNNDLTHISIFPKVENEVIISLIRRAKCCLAASGKGTIFQYGLSKYKLNEYLISGIPVVFACSYPNVVQETKNIVVESTDYAGFARAVLTYRKMDGKQWQEIGDSGRSVIESKYDYAVIGDKYMRMLEAL